MEITTVGTYRAQWGEGPIWWQGRLYYVDIEGCRVLALDPETGEEQEWQTDGRVGTVVPRKSGGLVIAGDNGIYFLDTDSGELEKVGDPEPDKANNRFNDGKCSPDGHFFAGTISLVKQQGDAALYRLSKSGEITEVFGDVTNSNGIVWSLDGGTVYYIDSPRKAVQAFSYKDGGLTDGQIVVSTADYPDSPDGMTIDSDGNLWIAFCHGARVVCYNPDTGEELRKIELPCLETTACAFGGENLEDLYVTTGVHKTEVEEKAGQLLVIKGLGVKGVPAFAYQG